MSRAQPYREHHQNQLRSSLDGARKLTIEQAYHDSKARQSHTGTALNPYHRSSQDSSVKRSGQNNNGSKRGDSSRFLQRNQDNCSALQRVMHSHAANQNHAAEHIHQSSEALSQQTASFGQSLPAQKAASGAQYRGTREADEKQLRYLRDKTNQMNAEKSHNPIKYSAPLHKTIPYSHQLDEKEYQYHSTTEESARASQDYQRGAQQRSKSRKDEHKERNASFPHQENARIARARIDMQTISEPTLVSSVRDIQGKSGSSRRENRVQPYLRQSIEQNEDYADARTSIQTRQSNEDVHENRPRQFEALRDSRDSSQQNDSSLFEKLRDETCSNQAFKSQQFQMNRNQTHSSHSTAGQNNSNNTMHHHSAASHLYAKHYSSGQHQQPQGGRSSKPRQPEMSQSAMDHANQVANYLTAQPSQTMTYGRRESKAQYHQTQVQPAQQYGASSKSIQQHESQQYQATSNLLQKSSKESYFNQLQIGSSSSGTQGQTRSSAGATQDHQSKQQMIQNLNQRYLAQNQNHHSSAQASHQRDFEQTNLSSQITAESVKQTAARSKTRPTGKSQTQHSSSHGAQSGQMKHTQASKAKTTSQVQPRKSSTSFYPSQSNTQNISGSKNTVAPRDPTALHNTVSGGLAANAQERPHSTLAGYLQSTQGQGTRTQNNDLKNRSFTGTTPLQAHDRQQVSFVENAALATTKTSKGKTTTSNTRSSTNHNIKGRNLNSNNGTSKLASYHNKMSTQEHLNQSNTSQILAVNMLPTSQPSFGGTATTSSYQRSGATTAGHTSVKNTSSQQRPSTATRPKSSAQLKSGSNQANTSKSSLQPNRQSHASSSGLGTAKSGSRIGQATLNHIKGAIGNTKHQNMSHMVMQDEDDSMLDVKHIEEMMRASQKSNIFTIAPPDSNERGSVVRDSNSSMMAKSVAMQDSSDRFSMLQQQQMSSANQYGRQSNASNLLNDISITSPTTGPPALHQQNQTPETVQKAKLRLETACLLLGENTAQSQSEKDKKQAAVANVLEEIIFNQANKFDQQCLRLLMDYQWQNAGNAQTFKLQDELAQVKARFENQTKLQNENKELREQLAKSKVLIQDQDRSVKKLERELAQLKHQFEVDHQETRMRPSQPERAASQQNRRSSTLVPPLDLSKVKAYEDHVREKIAQKSKEKAMNAYLKQPNSGNDVSGKKPSAQIEKSGSGAPSKLQMQTLQHHAAKVNNFVSGGEVNLSNMNTLAGGQKQASKANTALEKQYQSLEPTSHSLSPSMKSKGRNHAYLNQMRYSQENRPTSSNYYTSQTNASLDHVRSHHNYSATIEGSRVQQDQAAHQQKIQNRKRSMPPAQVHIPLLDFSKLHKPQQPTQSRAATKAVQPKQSVSQQHSKYQTIEAKAATGYNNHHYGNHQQAGAHQTIQHTSQKEYQHPLYQKKRGSYEQHANVSTNSQLRQSQERSLGIQKENSSSIGASQSVKVMTQQVVEEAHTMGLYGNTSSGMAKKGSAQLNMMVQKQISSSSMGNKYAGGSGGAKMSGGQQQAKQYEMLKQQVPSFKADFNTVV